MQRAVFIVMILPLLTQVQSNVTNDVATESSIEPFFTTDADNFTTEIVTIASLSDNETSCDVDSTNCTTLTTKEPPQDKKDNETKISQEIKGYSNKQVCSCDLQLQICDINCCCDKDCSYENKLVFEKCDRDENRVYDTSYCKYTTYIYKNNTAYEWEVTQNGLFCIVKSNLPASYSIHKEMKLNSLEDAHLQKSKKYSWSSIELNKTDIVFLPTSRFYYGQIVWILKNHSAIQPFELPYNFLTSACLTKKTVKFLKNFKAKCTHTIINEDNDSLSLENFIQNITIIAHPELINSTWNETHFKLCPKDICVPLEVKVCEKNLKKCSVPTRIDKFKFNCHFSLYNNEKFCNNIVRMVKYDFYHNGTRGISKVQAFIVLEDVTFNLNQNNPLYLQSFEVNYSWINHTLNYSLIRSGNPGYIIGKPILIARLITMRNSSNSSASNFTETLRRDYSDFTDNFMTFPSNTNGLCILNNSTNTPIEFGYNMIVKCKLKNQIEFKANLTAANMCRQLQINIFNYWSVKVGNESGLIGKFGNANASSIKDWMPVSYSIKPDEVLNYTKGLLNNRTSKLFCNGIYTHLKVDFYHGREVVSDLHNQEKILWTTFHFENKQNLYESDVKEKRIYFEADLQMEVMFFDVTGEKMKKFVDPPALDIKLPYDFFYPFIKISSNNCSMFFISYYSALLIVVLLCFCIN